LQNLSEIIIELLSKVGVAIVSYLANINPILSLLVAGGFAVLMFFLRRKIKKLWDSTVRSDSSTIADGMAEEQKFSHSVQSGLDNFLDSK
jgi:hypothetical protein